MSYVDEVLAKVKEKNASEPEFLQAVEEVLNSLRPVIDANEEKYRREALLERICEPERQLSSEFLGLMIRDRYRLTQVTEYSLTQLLDHTRVV